MRKLILMTAAAALIAGAACAQALNEKDAAGVLGKALAFEPKDAFDTGPSRSALADQEFHIAVPVHDGNAFSKQDFTPGGYWTYDRDKQVLTVHLSPTSMNMLSSRTGDAPYLDGFTFGGLPKVTGAPYEAQNGYGAKVMVTPTTVAEMVIGQTSKGYDPGKSSRHLGLKVDLPMEPDKARDLTAHLVLMIDGRIKAYDGKNTVTCETHVSTATTQNPMKMTMKACALTGTIERVAFQRSDTGEMIANWARPLD